MSIRNRIIDYRTVPARFLMADERNWRRHGDAQRQAMQAMLERIGYAGAVIARETEAGLTLIDGHLRADLDPNQEIPVLVVDLDEDEAGQLLASMDPLGAMADADLGALEALTKSLSEIPPIDYEAIYGRQPVPWDADADANITPPENPITQPGDIWVLGSHRLMCGDSGDEDAVAALLDGAAPRLMVTDPPYGVNYDPGWRVDAAERGTLAYAGTRNETVPNDHTVDWGPCLTVYAPTVAYVWSPPGDHQIHFARILQESGYNIRAQMIWRKPRLVISRGNYHWQHEPCWYAVRKGARSGWIGDRKQSTIWDIAWDKNVEGGHSTQKPVECMERPIRNHEGDVYDPFVGSGTTIIAAERQRRRCYAMEITPGYVDAAVQRWERYTGESAHREEVR